MSTHELKEGDPAPDIHLPDDKGADFQLSSLHGKNVILYFYPKADTPGCTKESCEFRDSVKKFVKKGVTVLGISPDTTKDQARFKQKFDLNFTLLADADKEIANKYGVMKEKNMYGKKVMGIERTTFLIGPDQTLIHVFPKVTPEGHAEEVLKLLKEWQKAHK